MIQSLNISTNQSSYNALEYTVKVDRNRIDLAELTILSKPGEYVEQKSTIIAKVNQSNGKTKNVLSNVSGFIQQVYSDRLTNSSIKICLIHSCNHAVVKFDEVNSKDICEKCGKDVWIKGDSVISTIKDIQEMTCGNKEKAAEKSHDLDVVSWCEKKVNQIVLAKEVIVQAQAISRSENARGYASSDEDENEDSDNDDDWNNNKKNNIIYDYYLDFPVIIREINRSFNQKRDWLIKYEKVVCSHSMAELNSNKEQVCSFCKETLSKSDMTNKSIYFGLGSEFKDKWLTRSYAEQYTVQAQKKLIALKRLILVLDLDNTVLHAVHAMTQAEYSQKGGEEEFCEVSKQGSVKYVVRLRPYFKEFIEQVLPHYEIYVFTMGVYEYASGICDFIRNKYSELLRAFPLAFSSERIISREAFHDPTCKNLNQILPNSDRFMVALDDRPDVWAKQPKNLITTLPYIYWSEGATSWNQIAMNAIMVLYKNGSKFRAAKKESRRKAKEEEGKNKNSASSEGTQEIEIEGSTIKLSGEVEKQSEDKSNAANNEMEVETSIRAEDEANDENIPEVNIDSFQLEADPEKDNVKQCDISYSSSVEDEEDDQTNSNQSSSLIIPENGTSSPSIIVEESPSQVVGVAELADSNGKEEIKIEIEIQKDKQSNGVEQIVTSPAKESSDENVKNKEKKKSEIFLHSKEFQKNMTMSAILQKFDKEENYSKPIKYNLKVLRSQDNYLLFAGPLLKELKAQFFSSSVEESERDIRPVFINYKKTILCGLVLVFKPNCQLYSFQRAKALGAAVFIEGDEDVPDKVDYVIGKQSECQPNVEGQVQPLVLISQWIDYCWFYSYKLDVTPFLPTTNPQKSNLDIEQEIIKLNLEPKKNII